MAADTTATVVLPPLVLGGAGFGYQTHPDPETLPVAVIVRRAFDAGLRAIDTAPLYAPSETLLGRALADPRVAGRYGRSDYVLMTKAGRNPGSPGEGGSSYDYSPAAITQSVHASLARLQTAYVDVVFCHDIEAVTDDDVLGAVAALRALVAAGLVRAVGLSGYRLDLLRRRAALAAIRFGPGAVAVVQAWGQLTLQNERLLLDREFLPGLAAAGVAHVLSASPLGIGLLRAGGVPRGRDDGGDDDDDFHPAPPGLRAASRELAAAVAAAGDSLAALGLRHSLCRAHAADRRVPGLRVSTITGVSTLAELAENVAALQQTLGSGDGDTDTDSHVAAQAERDRPLVDQAHAILGDWVNWSYTFPPPGWDPEKKCMK